MTYFQCKTKLILLNERINQIQEISKKTDYNNFVYLFKDSRIPSTHFIKFKGPLSFFEKIENGDIPLKEADEEQYLLISDLGAISSGNPKYKEKYQLDIIKNVRNLHNSR